MNISGRIKGITYDPLFIDNLQTFNIQTFNINDSPSTCILKTRNSSFAISKWVSPKRTRSYPYERVYNSLGMSKKITIIPVVKDEGLAGDRDFIQWDTVSLMSLLDVFVIFAYFDSAEINPRNKRKITNQSFNNEYITSKIKEIEKYHSSALHWNLNELNTNLLTIIEKVKTSYSKIQLQTKVAMHATKGLDNFKDKISQDITIFMKFSREKAQKAQSREIATIQPKESLSSLSKSKITITNYLGGQYFFTVDEIIVGKSTLYLIEGKHSKTNILPSKSDIKDGLLKMILYSNLDSITLNSKKTNFEAVLLLTSSKLKGSISTQDNKTSRNDFYKKNHLTLVQINCIETIISEAKIKSFNVIIKHSR